MTDVPTKTLPSGDEIPLVGMGTWTLTGEEGKKPIRASLDAGYTHLDCAEGYQNEAEIGEILTDFEREELFLTSKVLPSNLGYESLQKSCKASLERLGIDYLDLYLIHWPNPAISLRESLDAMAKLHEEGLVRNVGVSNFSVYQLSCARHISDVPIAVNQIEYHPLYQQSEVVEYCRDNEILIEAAAPLAETEVFGEAPVQDLAEKYDKSPAQVVLRWSIERDVVVIPRSSSPEHIRGNLDVFDFSLDDDELSRLDELDRNHAVYHHTVPDWGRDIYGISE